MTVHLLLQGLALGIGAAAPIGPVNVEIARRTLRHGLHGGFLLGCGAVTVDVTYAIITSFGVAHLADWPGVRIGLGLAGGALLAYLGTMSLVAARRQVSIEPCEAAPVSGGSHYVTGVLMTLTNPMTLAFWFVAVPGAAGPIRHGLAIICAGVFLATLAWVCFFTGLIHMLGQRRKRAWLIAADLVGGVTLLTFAMATIWRSAALLL